MGLIYSRTLCLCALATIAACSGSKKSFATFTPVSQMVTASQGGTVTASNGTIVMVPPGAVQSDTTITMAPSTSTPPANLNQAGISVQFGPSGTQFAQPVTVKLPYDPGLIPSGAIAGIWTQEDQPGSPWQFIGGQAAGSGFFQTQTTHFSSCVVGIEPMGGGGGGGTGGGGGGGGSTGGDCNANVFGGPTLPEQQMATSAPAPQGGSVQNGTYYETSLVLYTGTGGATGPTGNTRQATIVISNSSTTSATIQIAELKYDVNNGTSTNRQNIIANWSSTSFTQTVTCPTGSTQGNGTLGYTVSGNTFIVFDNGNGGGTTTKMQTFTLQ